MLDYTLAAGNRVWRNIRRTSLTFNIVMQVISILYLTYILFRGTGIVAINLILLTLSCGYLAFYCCTLAMGLKGKVKFTVKQVFKWSRRAIKLVNLGITLYAILTTPSPEALDTVLAITTLGIWVIDLFIEIASLVIRNWGMLIYEGLKADVEKATMPLTATKNFFKKMTGQEVEEKPAPTKRRLFLDKLVGERKRARREEKLAKKEEKLAAKQAKKESQRTPTPPILEETAVSNDEK